MPGICLSEYPKCSCPKNSLIKECVSCVGKWGLVNEWDKLCVRGLKCELICCVIMPVSVLY